MSSGLGRGHLLGNIVSGGGVVVIEAPLVFAAASSIVSDMGRTSIVGLRLPCLSPLLGRALFLFDTGFVSKSHTATGGALGGSAPMSRRRRRRA